MRMKAFMLCILTACGTDVRSSQDSDPGVDGGQQVDGGSPTTVVDARVPPPDGIPAGLAPCDEAPYHSDFAFVEEKVFSASCGGDCHGGADPKASMDLTGGRAYANLINMPSTQFSGWMRVVPGDPGASMLMVQVGGEPGPELEGFMPWGEPRLCEPLVDAMRRWIAAGALQN